MALNEANIGGPDRDPDLERLYGRTRLEEPRRELDQAIRAAARREVRARPQALGARLRRWTLPVSLAAVIVLSVSVVTLMRDEGAGRVGESLSSAPAKQGATAGAPSSGAKPKAAGSAEAPAGMRTPAPLMARPSAQDTKGEERPRAPVAGRVRPAEPVAGDVRREAAEGAMESKPQQAPATPEASATAPASRPARAFSAPAPSLRSAPVEAESDSSGKRELTKSKRSLTDSQFNELLKDLEGAPPEKWLEKIAALRREGHSLAADDLLSRFKGRFPDYPLPASDRRPGS